MIEKSMLYFNLFKLKYIYLFFRSYDHSPPPLIRPRVNGPFGLDQDVIAEIERGWIRSDQMVQRDSINVDLSFLNSPLKIVEKDGVSYPTDQLQRLISMQPMIPQHPNYTMSPPQPISAIYNSTRSTNIKQVFFSLNLISLINFKYI